MGIVVRQSIYTSIISYIGVIIGYINLIYLYPKYLELNEVGLIRTIQDAAMLLAPFAQVGLAHSIMRFYPQFANDAKGKQGFINLIILLSILGFGIFLMIYFSFEPLILSFFHDKAGDLLQYTHLILWLTFLLLAITLMEFYSRALLKIAVPNFLREIVIRVLQALLVTIYFLHYISFEQLLVYSVGIYVIALLLLAVYLFRSGDTYTSFSFSILPKKKSLEIIQYSALSFIGTGSMILIAKTDSLMVAGMLGLSANAIYTTAFYMATVIEIPKRAITQTAATIISRAFEKNDIKEVRNIYQKTSINQFIIGALLWIGVWANLHNIFEIMPKGEEYKTGAFVVVIVGLGKLIDMFFGPSSEIIVLSKYYWFNIVLIAMLAGIGITCNYLFIPKFGVNGAAYGTALALSIFNLAKYIFIYGRMKIQPFSKATVKVIIISAVVVAANYTLPVIKNVFVDILYRSTVITILFGGMILITKSSDEVNSIFFAVLNKVRIKR